MTGKFINYNKRFVLDEFKLRKIVDIIKTSFQKKKIKINIVFWVFKNDSTFLKTKKIDEVLNEPNLKKQEIHALGIKVTNDDGELHANINFKNYSNTIEIEIASDDRDLTMILINDLEALIDSIFEERKFYSIASKSYSDIIFFIFLLIVFGLILTTIVGMIIDERKINLLNDLSKLSIDEKLVEIYFIDNPFGNLLYYGILVGITTLISIYFYFRPISTFFKKRNKSFFVWGDGKKRYERFCNVENNIKWVVVIGGILSIVIGVVLKIILK